MSESEMWRKYDAPTTLEEDRGLSEADVIGVLTGRADAAGPYQDVEHAIESTYDPEQEGSFQEYAERVMDLMDLQVHADSPRLKGRKYQSWSGLV